MIEIKLMGLRMILMEIWIVSMVVIINWKVMRI